MLLDATLEVKIYFLNFLETICKNAADVTLCNLFFADYKTVSAYLSCGNDTPLVTLKAYSAIDCTGESSTRNHAFNACTNDIVI